MKKLFLVMVLCLGLAGAASAQLWQSQDVGGPALAGSAVVNADGSIVVTGGGADIWGASDQFHFAFMELPGDGDIDIRARITGVSGGDNEWRKFGVMIRDKLTGGSRHAYMAGTTNQGVRWQGRRDEDTANCGNVANIAGGPIPFAAPYWVRIFRTGGMYHAYGSLDGVNWTLAPENTTAPGPDQADERLYNPHPHQMTSPVYVGLAVTSHNNAHLTTATFDNVTINGVPFGGEPWGAVAWDPAPDSKDIPVGVYPLAWDAVAPEGETIRDFKVYLSDDVADIDPNNPSVEDYLLGGGAVSEMTVDSPVLLNDKTYYWRIASYISDTNSINGSIVKFDTVSYAPVIIQQPQSTRYAPACSAVLTVTAAPKVEGEGGPITYQWFKVGDANSLPGATNDTFVTTNNGDYYVVVSNDAGSLQSNAANVAASVHAAPGAGDGQAFFELFDPAGGDLAAAREMLTLSATPTYTEMVSITEWGRGETNRDNYRARLTTWLMPAESGQYRFRLASDDHGVLWISTDADPANAVEIATVPDWTNIDEWGKHGSQTSQPIELQAGLVYFLRGAYREGGGGDHIHIQWERPGIGWQTISGGVMNSFLPDMWAVRNVAYGPVDTNNWVYYDAENLTMTWDSAQYAPCDAVYSLYLSQDREAVLNPDSGLTPIYQGAGMAVVIPNAGTLDLAHDQTWYYRIDVSSAAGADSELGTTFSFDTVKWVPEIATHPKDLNVVKAGSDLTLQCVASALNDDEAAMTEYSWYRVGDANPVYTGIPTEISRDGKRYYDCSIVLTVEGLAQEGFYYCVAKNENGDAQSNTAKVLTERLMVHYEFEAINNGIVVDSSPTKANGTLTSPTGLGTDRITGGIVPGVVGNAIDLVGGSDPNAAYIATSMTAFDLGIRGANPRSVSVWARTRNMARSGVYSIGRYGQSMQVFGVHTQNDPGNNFVYQFDHWGSNFDYTNWKAFGAWVHIVHVYDGQRIRIYVEGVRVADYAASLNTTSGGEAQNLAVGFWGQYDAAAAQHGVFNGQIDDFRLYNYALSPVEVGQLWVLGGGAGGCMEQLSQDLNGDCKVDLQDFAILAASWLEDTLVTP